MHDSGGLDFTFFWQPLDDKLDTDWHPLFREALLCIRSVKENEK